MRRTCTEVENNIIRHQVNKLSVDIYKYLIESSD